MLLCAELQRAADGTETARITTSGGLAFADPPEPGLGDPRLALKTAPEGGYWQQTTLPMPFDDDVYLFFQAGNRYGKVALNSGEAWKERRQPRQLYIDLHLALQADGSTALETDRCWTQGWSCAWQYEPRFRPGTAPLKPTSAPASTEVPANGLP